MKTKSESRTRLIGVTGEDLIPHCQSGVGHKIRKFDLLTHTTPAARLLLQNVSFD